MRCSTRVNVITSQIVAGEEVDVARKDGSDFKKGERDFSAKSDMGYVGEKPDLTSAMKTYTNGIVAPNRVRTVVGNLTGREHKFPDWQTGYPVCLLDGGEDGNRKMDWKPEEQVWLDRQDTGFPACLEERCKFMLVVPSTNTTVEHDYWRMLFDAKIKGVGFHTAPILIEAPKLVTDEDMLEFLVQFRRQILYTLDVGMTAQPDYIIMGMSAETFFGGMEGNMELVGEITDRSGLGVATGAEACKYALEAFGKLPDGTNKIKTISIVDPYVTIGDVNVIKFFEEVGFKVQEIHGFKSGSATDIAHIPADACEQVIRRLAEGRPDAIVQCGTNLSMVDVADRMEMEVGIPIIAINAATLWFALRELGFNDPIPGATRLLREH